MLDNVNTSLPEESGAQLEDEKELPALDLARQSTDQEIKPSSDLSLPGFMRDFGASLMTSVSRQNPAVYSPDDLNHARHGVLNGLKRTPFAAQQNVVQAVVRLLIDKGEKAAIINADMGTGKSMMGIAAAAVMHAEGYARTLILSPPHLVYKWCREILDTLENAQVWILNGADALQTLMRQREKLKNERTNPAQRQSYGPKFFILGRVRLRMGGEWKPAFALYKKKYAVCPDCRTLAKDAFGDPLTTANFLKDKKCCCAQCKTPLWSAVRQGGQAQMNLDCPETLKKVLTKLPAVGRQKAQTLLAQFGQKALAHMLSDNLPQFTQLMDENGEFLFSERQALRIEKALSALTFQTAQGSYQISEFIKRYFPKHYFGLLIVDEAHEYKSLQSAQGQAMGVTAHQAKKVLLLTGTLMGGYADDLFFLLWRCLGQKMREDGYKYYRRSLNNAATAFMAHHGVLKRVYKTTEEASHIKPPEARKVP